MRLPLPESTLPVILQWLEALVKSITEEEKRWLRGLPKFDEARLRWVSEAEDMVPFVADPTKIIE